MGATMGVVRASHRAAAAKERVELAAFIDECKRGSTMEADLATQEKKGLPTDMTVRHPLTGELLPVWVANYVLMGYGEGAVMAVPAHDERDFAFAGRYGLPVRTVIASATGKYETVAAPWQEAYAEPGVLVDSGETPAFPVAAWTHRCCAQQQGLVQKRVQFRLRDGESRGSVMGCDSISLSGRGDVPVPTKIFPCGARGPGAGLQRNPLGRRPVLSCQCPSAARRPARTVPGYLRGFLCYFGVSHAARAAMWIAREFWLRGTSTSSHRHAILHLLSRASGRGHALDRLVKTPEPFANLLTQGMVLNHIFVRTSAAGRREYFNPADVDLVLDATTREPAATLKSDGSPVTYEGFGTMSKSRLNGVDPNVLTGRYGADTARGMMFRTAGTSLDWSETAGGANASCAGCGSGIDRCLRRGWRGHLEGRACGRRVSAGDRDSEGRTPKMAKVEDDIGRAACSTRVASVWTDQRVGRTRRIRGHGRRTRRPPEALEIAVWASRRWCACLPELGSIWGRACAVARAGAADAAALVQDSRGSGAGEWKCAAKSVAPGATERSDRGAAEERCAVFRRDPRR